MCIPDEVCTVDEKGVPMDAKEGRLFGQPRAVLLICEKVVSDNLKLYVEVHRHGNRLERPQLIQIVFPIIADQRSQFAQSI